MKNWNIRKKMVPIYIIISIFTFLLFFAALFVMQRLLGTSPEEGAAIVRTFGWCFIGYLVIYFVLIFSAGRKVAKQVAFPAKDLVEAAEKISQGDVDIELSHVSGDEMGKLTDGFRIMVKAIQEQARVLSTIAKGDYTAEISLRGEKDVINQAIIEMLDNNNHMVSDIRMAAVQVSGGAHQIAQGAQTLATGSTQQAATVQEFQATMEDVKQKSIDNLGAAQEALDVTEQTSQRMSEGMLSMEKVASAMQAIDESSAKITNVIKVIEDIAFQTNILALNAAVEAARAGEHGKGFAVVADEVRNLATKSADAAKETGALINDSNQRVQEGADVVGATNEAMNAVAELAGRTQQLVRDISGASTTQTKAIEELAMGMAQISQVVQANSATSEESAAAAQQMSAQASLLERTVAQFKLRQQAQVQALPQPMEYGM